VCLFAVVPVISPLMVPSGSFPELTVTLSDGGRWVNPGALEQPSGDEAHKLLDEIVHMLADMRRGLLGDRR
jgi:hypothetical protein